MPFIPEEEPRIKKGEEKEIIYDRRKVINPAPHSNDFSPDWYDAISGVELALATGPLVEDKKERDKNNIMFWVRVRGKNRNGQDVTLPLIHEKMDLVDIRSGEIVANGYVSERYITSKRIMGYVCLNPLYWDLNSPFYYT
jgi:hypothetical protein